jgi:hypothetical protein
MPAPSSKSFVEKLEERRLLSGGASVFAPPPPVTRVPPVNGGFESFPDLTGWQTAGNDSVAPSSFVPAPEGNAQASISNSQIGPNAPVDAATLAGFLGLNNANALNNHGKTAVNGSAIKQDVTGRAGDIISFKADFLTNEANTQGKGDYGFVTLTFNGKTQLFRLSDFTHATSPLIFASSGFASETGYHTYALILPKSGTYTIGFGVVNVGDSLIASNLLVDNVQLTPFPIILGHGGDDHGNSGGDHDGDQHGVLGDNDD